MLVLVMLGMMVLQEPDVEALLRQLGDESIEVREKAAAALLGEGDKVEEAVRKRLATAEGEIKARCEGILRAIANQRKLAASLPPLKLATLDAKDAKLRDVLEELRRQTGMAMELDGIPDMAVSVDARNAAPLEALTAVCKSAGLGWFVDRSMRRSRGIPESKGPSIRFQTDGYIDAPRFFVRHYAVTPTGINIHKWSDFRTPGSSATLQLRLSWTPETKPESVAIDVTSVTDDKGRALFQPAKGAVPGLGPVNRAHLEHPIQLSIPEHDARAIASLRGTARIRYLKEEKTLVFDRPEECLGQKRESDGLIVELRDFKIESGKLRLSVAITGQRATPGPEASTLASVSHRKVVRAKLDDGTYAAVSQLPIHATASTINLDFRNGTSKVVALEIVVETLYYDDSFDFELKDIPLPK